MWLATSDDPVRRGASMNPRTAQDQCQVDALLPMTATWFQVDAATVECHVEAAEFLCHVEAAWSELVAVTVARTTTNMRAMAANSATSVRAEMVRAVMALLLFLGF